MQLLLSMENSIMEKKLTSIYGHHKLQINVWPPQGGNGLLKFGSLMVVIDLSPVKLSRELKYCSVTMNVNNHRKACKSRTTRTDKFEGNVAHVYDVEALECEV